MSIDAEVTANLKRARDCVAVAGVPAELAPVAFALAFQALGSSSSSASPQINETPKPAPAPATGNPLTQLANSLGVTKEIVSNVYEVSDDGLILVVRRSDLPTAKSAATRAVALLVVVGRQLLGLEEWTEYETVREECKELKVFDTANFAAYVDKLEFRTQGRGPSKSAKANRHHVDEAADVVRELGAV